MSDNAKEAHEALRLATERLLNIVANIDCHEAIDTHVAVVAAAVCSVVGHSPVSDHCGIPEHDYCIICGSETPGMAPRKESQ